MAAVPDPKSVMTSFFVQKTSCSPSVTAWNILRNRGVRWWNIGADIA